MTEFVTKNYRGVEFRVVDPRTYDYGSYEFEDETATKDAHWADIKPGEVVVDIGASWGGYTVPALIQGARVVAVECCEKGFATLGETVAANGWTDRCTMVKAVLGNGGPDFDPTYTRDILQRNFPTADTTERLTLDALVYRLGLGRVDRVKMDVEGAELSILEGALVTLRRFRPALLIEDHTAESEEHKQWMPALVGMRDKVRSLLEEYGYTVTLERPPTGNPFLYAAHG